MAAYRRMANILTPPLKLKTMHEFSTWYNGVKYTANASGYYSAYVRLAYLIFDTVGNFPLEIEIDSKLGTKSLKLEMQ